MRVLFITWFLQNVVCNVTMLYDPILPTRYFSDSSLYASTSSSSVFYVRRLNGLIAIATAS